MEEKNSYVWRFSITHKHREFFVTFNTTSHLTNRTQTEWILGDTRTRQPMVLAPVARSLEKTVISRGTRRSYARFKCLLFVFLGFTPGALVEFYYFPNLIRYITRRRVRAWRVQVAVTVVPIKNSCFLYVLRYGFRRLHCPQTLRRAWQVRVRVRQSAALLRLVSLNKRLGTLKIIIFF